MNEIDLAKTHDIVGSYVTYNFFDIRNEYADPGTQYAFDVLDGKKQAGYMMQLACLRHLRDLRHQSEPDFPYTYDLAEAGKVLKFAKVCPNVDTGEPTALMGWQEFLLSQSFGWRNETGGKRFSQVIVSVGRSQGKTYIQAISMCFSYLFESLGLSNQDYLVSSINFKQTMKLMGYIKNMLKQIITKEPFKSLAEELDLSIQSEQVIMRANNNVLRAISSESGNYDGFHFTNAIMDESGDLKDRTSISKIVSGQVKIPNRQFIQISTAYPNPTSPLRKDERIMQGIMERDDRSGDTQLCLVWSQDSPDEVYKPETWSKSNPLLDLESEHDTLLKGLMDKRDADLLSGNLNDFLIKNMNLWGKQDENSFLKLEDIERSVISDFDIKGRQVYIGVDYSMFSDNTAFGFVYPYQDEDDNPKYHLEQHSFIPWQQAGSIEAKEKMDGINYRDLADKGFCTITSHPQGLINDDEVYQWLCEYVEDNELQVLFFGYDSMGVSKVIKALELNTSYPLMAIRQRTSELKDPTKFLQTLFIEGNCTRLDDEIMEKALVNAVIKEDNIGIQVDKKMSTLKIDVVDALIDALYQAMFHFEDYGLAQNNSYMVQHMSQQAVLDWFNNPESGLLEEELYDYDDF